MLGTVGGSTCVSVVESVVEMVELIVAPVTDAIAMDCAGGIPDLNPPQIGLSFLFRLIP